MSNLAYSEKYTVEDYKVWKGDWELIYGDAYAMAPSPEYGHQFVNLKIARPGVGLWYNYLSKY